MSNVCPFKFKVQLFYCADKVIVDLSHSSPMFMECAFIRVAKCACEDREAF